MVNAATGTVAERIDYDAWGNVTLDTNPGFVCQGYAGGLRDEATELVRFGARDYDPAVGRWTCKDPIGFAGGLNRYGYVGGNPIDASDPTGLAAYILLSEAGTRSIGPLSFEGGPILVIDPQSGAVHQFMYAGVGLGFGFGWALTTESARSS